MQIEYYPYTLQLKHTFTISTYSRNSTPAVLIELKDGGITGHGEISMPQYLGETVESASAFLNKADLSQFNIADGIDKPLDYINSLSEGNCAAKAGLDIALHDLYGKFIQAPAREIYSIPGGESPAISFTIGIDREDVLIKKIGEAAEFKILKIKLGTVDDKGIIEAIRRITDKSLIVDINQGWDEKNYALDMAHYLKEMGVLLIEQPFKKEDRAAQQWLCERSPIPVFADESVQRLRDIEGARGLFHGINIKLMKCTGMREAYSMIIKAREYGMKVMLGCMTETSCAIAAAAQISPLADYADLDGNLLISNDPFEGVELKEGKIILNSRPGLGIEKIT